MLTKCSEVAVVIGCPWVHVDLVNVVHRYSPDASGVKRRWCQPWLGRAVISILADKKNKTSDNEKSQSRAQHLSCATIRRACLLVRLFTSL